MYRLLTAMTLAALFSTAALAKAGPDLGERPDAPQVCDSDQFRNQGQWIQCLRDHGLRGRALARAIHREHHARKGEGPATCHGKRKALRRSHRAKHARRDARPRACRG